MRGLSICLFLMLLLAACSTPSEAAVQTAVAATVAARPSVTTAPTGTAQPTGTPEPTNRPEPSSTPLPANTPEQAPVQVSGDDAGKIYAAAIRQMYGIEFSFGGEPPERSKVFIVTTTDDGTLLEAPATVPQKLTAELRHSIKSELADQPFEIVWVESLDEAPLDPDNGKIAEGEGIVVTLGNILPQDEGTVHLPFYMLCGPLCLSGKTYVLAEVAGIWQVTGSVGLEVTG